MAVSIIVPVYGDWPSLKECIESLKKNIRKDDTVLFANDCGPEVDIIEANIKEAIKDDARFIYHRNEKNMGFVKNCNNAVLNIDKTNNDVLLLNSDTVVTEGFLDELEAVLKSDDQIGAVSPRSNNATIATTPLKAMKTRGVEPKDAYKYFLKNHKKYFKRVSFPPVAHGFCMLINRELIKQYGLFDEAFGMGYGEEVDFCLRIRAHGYKSAIANWAFVYHLEARSFGIDKKKELISNSKKIIDERYPSFSKDVQEYIQETLIEEELNPAVKVARLFKQKH